MKTSTKVIIKFQIFTGIILLVVLLSVNILFFRLALNSYDEKINKITHRLWHIKWWKFRDWQLVKNNCFDMYWNRFCLSNSICCWIYKQWNYFFYVKNWIVFDITNSVLLYNNLLKLSILIFCLYLLLSYPLWKLFLNTIYKKIFSAVESLEKENFIDIKKMGLSNDDELKILFDTINNQIDTISSFNKYLSHELKTPLMKILSTLDLLKLKYNDEKITSLKEEIFYIKDIIESLNKLILVETRNYKIEKDYFDVCNYINNFSEKLWLNVLIFCKNKDKLIFTSKELFSLVLKNILENAKKYSKWDVKIIITDEYIIFENEASKINDVSKLTDRFYKESDKWLWIGLYLVKKICDILWYKLEISYNQGIFKLKILF